MPVTDPDTITDAIADTIADTIVSLCAQRGPAKTCCPSEVARRIAPDDWRGHMDAVRAAAVALHKRGRVRVLQRGRLVSTDTPITGPIRLQIVTDDPPETS